MGHLVGAPGLHPGVQIASLHLLHGAVERTDGCKKLTAHAHGDGGAQAQAQQDGHSGHQIQQAHDPSGQGFWLLENQAEAAGAAGPDVIGVLSTPVQRQAGEQPLPQDGSQPSVPQTGGGVHLVPEGVQHQYAAGGACPLLKEPLEVPLGQVQDHIAHHPLPLPNRAGGLEEAARAALAKVVHIPVDDIRGAPGGLEQAPVYAEAAAAGEASGGVKTVAAGVKEGKGGVVEQGAGGIVEDGVDILSHVGVAGVQGAADPSAAPEAVHHLSAGVQQAVQVAAQGVQLRLGGIGHAAVKGGLEDAQHEDGTQQQWHHADQQEAHQQLGAEGAVEKVPHARSSPHSASHRAVNSSFSPAAQWTS